MKMHLKLPCTMPSLPVSANSEIARKRDIHNFELSSGFQTIITNPPYGERLLDIRSAEEICAVMGKKFLPHKGKSYTVITPDDDFEKIFRTQSRQTQKNVQRHSEMSDLYVLW